MRLINSIHYASRMLGSLIRRTPSLTLAFIYPSYRCNLRCTYCNLPNIATDELPTEQWLGVIDQLASLGCRRINILGGEPLIYPNISDLIVRVRKQGMSCILGSNGLLVKKMIDQIRLVNTLVLSLDAVGPSNEQVRGDGVFESVKEAIAAAKDAGIPVKLNAVLSEKTAQKIDEILGFTDQHDLYITVNVMRSESPYLHRNAAHIKAENAEIQRVLQRLTILSQTNPRLLISSPSYHYASHWKDYSKDRLDADELSSLDSILRNNPRCQAGRYYMTISPDGIVYPCIITMGSVPGGNVVTDGVAKAWQKLHNHSCAACFSLCMVELNHLFSLSPKVLLNFMIRHLRRFS